MDQSQLQKLLDHMQWADALVWACLLDHREARSDEQIRACAHHTHQVQWAYLQLWRDEKLSLTDLSAFNDVFAIYQWCRRYYAQLTDYRGALDTVSLERQIQFPWADELVKQWGSAQPVTLAESILQITFHTTYHRGQMNRRLRELGAEPPLTDFVVWIWMGRPAPEWKTDIAG
jgi:uncharacterized damage-inducible protein DinB